MRDPVVWVLAGAAPGFVMGLGAGMWITATAWKRDREAKSA